MWLWRLCRLTAGEHHHLVNWCRSLCEVVVSDLLCQLSKLPKKCNPRLWFAYYGHARRDSLDQRYWITRLAFSWNLGRRWSIGSFRFSSGSTRKDPSWVPRRGTTCGLRLWYPLVNLPLGLFDCPFLRVPNCPRWCFQSMSVAYMHRLEQSRTSLGRQIELAQSPLLSARCHVFGGHVTRELSA